mmetsp:Transcript_7302/g.13127  ORF Transcript_7302/g.13127 Transcript_7302/m.13127 type:complete len:985 (-) Transcript_7302:28-2982(-)
MPSFGKATSEELVSSGSDENGPAAALALALTSAVRPSPQRSASLGPPAGTASDASDSDDDDDDEDNETNHPQTRVDGKGLWRSWKRNFKIKLLALLDLIDNSLDASIVVDGGTDGNADGEEEDSSDFVGRVHIYPDVVNHRSNNNQVATAARGNATAAASINGGETDNTQTAANSTNGATSRYFNNDNNNAQPQRPNSAPELVFSGNTTQTPQEEEEEEDVQIVLPSTTTNTGLCIVNNSVRPIRPLVRVLEVYNSSKIDSGAGDIGENGVGLKQGCATLSDLSFVLVKNGQDGFVELGIVAESLQRAEGCYLPAFQFTISDDDDDTNQSLKDQMTTLFSQPKHRKVAKCIKQYGSAMEGDTSNMEKGIDRLLKHFDSVLNFFNNQFVFAVILDNISYGNPNDKTRKAADPIRDLREAIPRTYLHIPPSFDFRIGNSRAGREKIIFHYWPQRLVELSSFTVTVNENVPWYDPQAHVGTYKLRVFLGFDRFRINEDNKGASLYVYSRESGRLIKCEPDARFMLGLNASGSMYCSGLTVLIDDIEGKLPLNPTKQDVAFGEQANGEVHKDNLYAWVGSVTKFFYEYHLEKFDKKKTRLTAKIKEFGSELVQTQLKEIDRSQVTTFHAKFKHYGKRSIRIDQRSAEENAGPDTHMTLICDRPPPVVSKPPPVVSNQPSKKRKLDATQEHHRQPVQVKSEGSTRMQPAQSVQQPVARAIPNYPQGGAQHQSYNGQRVPAPPNYPPNYRDLVGNHPPHAHPQQHLPQHIHQPYHGHPQYTNGNNQQTQPVIHQQQHSRSQVNHRVQQIPQQQQQQHAGPIPSPLDRAIAASRPSVAMPRTGQGIQPPSQTCDTGVSISRNAQHAAEKEAERVARAGRNAANNDASRASTSPVAASTAKAPGDHATGRKEIGSGAVAEEVINLADDDDDSVHSTKDYYKDFCYKLTLRLEKRKGADEKRKNENQRLKEEIVQLRNEVERQKLLLNQAQHH